VKGSGRGGQQQRARIKGGGLCCTKKKKKKKNLVVVVVWADCANYINGPLHPTTVALIGPRIPTLLT
jgi:hypothetical protein